MSGLVCGAPRVMFLPGVSAVRLKQSTSLPRLACLTVLIYPQLRWVIVCRLADAPSLNSSSNPFQSSCSVGGRGAPGGEREERLEELRGRLRKQPWSSPPATLLQGPSGLQAHR